MTEVIRIVMDRLPEYGPMGELLLQYVNDRSAGVSENDAWLKLKAAIYNRDREKDRRELDRLSAWQKSLDDFKANIERRWM